jgi:uncharacterized membrane protein YeaQ/YmgE (transglycosylase-associated protein family)
MGIVGLVVVVLAAIAAVLLIHTIVNLLWLLAGGLVIGMLARIFLARRREVGCLGTAILGVIGSFLGGIIARTLIHHGGVVIQLLLGVLCAAVLITLFTRRRR